MLTERRDIKKNIETGVFRKMATSDQIKAVGQGQPVVVTNKSGCSPVVLVCEHASRYIPTSLASLGLSDDARNSHVAWDPGAMAVALRLSQIMDARLVSSGVSRLVYDCNRPPSAVDAMPVKSEIFAVPGNADLDAGARAARVKQFYVPFRDALAGEVAAVGHPAVVTIHSFTPVYFGKPRDVDIGILHDTDARLADSMLAMSKQHTDLRVARNSPYGPKDGVTHTLKEHAIAAGHLNVMLEIRNDEIATPQQQDRIAGMLAQWISAALGDLGVQLQEKGAACQG